MCGTIGGRHIVTLLKSSTPAASIGLIASNTYNYINLYQFLMLVNPIRFDVIGTSRSREPKCLAFHRSRLPVGSPAAAFRTVPQAKWAVAADSWAVPLEKWTATVAAWTVADSE